MGSTSGWSTTVQTDKPCYDVGDTVCVSGILTYNDYPTQTVQVAISVIASGSGDRYFSGSPTTDIDGKYSANFTIRSDAELGIYVVHANAEGVHNQTTFQVTDPICIKETGDVEPANAPISRNGNVYSLTGNISANSTDGIVIEKSNIILDGAGFTLTGKSLIASNGINVTSVSNVTIQNISVKLFHNGIYGYSFSNGQIAGSNLFSDDNGIRFDYSDSNMIEGNNITQNAYAGVWLHTSQNNNISSNRLAYNSIASNHVGGINLEGLSNNNNIVGNSLVNNTWYGIYIWDSGFNNIFHNNFINNTFQAYLLESLGNSWDDGYPSGGNYWSDYNGPDLLSGPYQNATGSDAMGDTPYALYGNEIDHYPLMQPWTGLLAQSSISMAFSVNPLLIDLPVTCTAAVLGSNPTGTVIWSTNSSTGSFSPVVSTMFSGNCSTTYIDTSAGTPTITANYSGDLNNAQSNASNTLTVCHVTTFDQVGVGSNFTGTIMTIDGINYSTSDLPVSFLWIEGSSHSFSYASPLSASTGEQYVWKSTAGLSNIQNGSLIVTASGIVIGNYSTQYYLTLAASPFGVNARFGQGWYDAGSYASIWAAQYVDITPGFSRYNFTGWAANDMTELTDPASATTTALMDMAKTVTANYVTQYNVTFATPSIDQDSNNTVVVIDGSNYDIEAFPISFWWDNSSTHTFSFLSPLFDTSGKKQYNWTSTTGLSSLRSDSIAVLGSGAVVGNYVTLIHDIAVSGLSSDKTSVEQGHILHVNVTIANLGNFTENFNLTVYANSTSVAQQVVTLENESTAVVNFTWNTSGFAVGNYTLSAVADAVPGDVNTLNNAHADGIIAVRLIGDINGDFIVNIRDLALVTRAFGTIAGNPMWNPMADENGDGKIDIRDIAIVAKHFGEHSP